MGLLPGQEGIEKVVSGRKVMLEFEVPGKLERGGYGRILAYVWVDDMNVNVEIVRLEWTTFWTKYGEGKYADEFKAAEQEAREAERGLWKD